MAKQWYVLRVISGKEDQIRDTLDKRVKSAGLTDSVGRILVPTESVTEMKGGRKRITKHKIYPGYIMIEMEMEEDVWFIIRETSGIGDFLGSAKHAVAMKPHEVEKVLGEVTTKEEKPRLKIDFKVGESVRIKEGPFENFDGVVEEVIPAKGLVKVIVTIFGRATPVELEYWQVESV